MVKVLFFAALREELQCAELSVSVCGTIVLDEFKKLIEDRLQGASEMFSRQDILCAVNQNIISGKTSVHVQDGDEVAFFPPVTGG